MTMKIFDETIETINGSKFSLHYRQLKNKTFSGFLRNVHWPKNCSISIPKIKGRSKFQKIVGTVIDNEDKFNRCNTLGRPRYYDILSEGIEGLKDQNSVFKLCSENPEFHTYKNSKRMWYYKSIGGNFNMRSIKINHVRLIDSVSFKELLPFIEDEGVKDILVGLKKKKFEFENDFIEFCNQLIDATQDTLIHSYNQYMKSLFGTCKITMRHTKSGKESLTYHVYIPKDADVFEKSQYRTQGFKAVPHGVNKKNVKVIEISLFAESALHDAESLKVKHDKIEALRKYFKR